MQMRCVRCGVARPEGLAVAAVVAVRVFVLPRLVEPFDDTLVSGR